MAEVGFSVRTSRLLEQAETMCEGRGTRLTELRRQVLGLVLDSAKPAGAYDLLDRLRAHHKGAAPPTVYRALEFLLEQGLIHKVERLAAFVGCVHRLEHAEVPHAECAPHAVQFLICKRCGQVTEVEDAAIGRALAGAASVHGFTPLGSTVEVEGICAPCGRAT